MTSIAERVVKCFRCGRRPAAIDEYVIFAKEAKVTPEIYVIQEEGTYNKFNGHFCCTDCYIEIGQPTGIGGRRWIAP